MVGALFPLPNMPSWLAQVQRNLSGGCISDVPPGRFTPGEGDLPLEIPSPVCLIAYRKLQ